MRKLWMQRVLTGIVVAGGLMMAAATLSPSRRVHTPAQKPIHSRGRITWRPVTATSAAW